MLAMGSDNILIVDDDPNMLKLVSRVLKLEGFDVSTAADGSSALGLVEHGEPALVLLDIMMPGLDGFQVIDLIRKHSSVPIIMLTARNDVALIQRALVIGADDYIKKPFSTRVLIARIRAKLRRST